MMYGLSYDRNALRARAAHIGVGAFHRAHQQSYYDDLARQGADWGIVGINLTAPDLRTDHQRQGGTYALLTEDGEDQTCREIGTLLRMHDRANAAHVEWNEISFVTLTITEKGYCHHAGSSTLDIEKVAADLAAPETPETAIGYLAWMLEKRRRARGGPITLASCDNVADNGVLLGSVLRDYVERAFPDLIVWLEDNVAFPTSMVDRIVPAMSDDARARLEAACGRPDSIGVVAEPFRQWVIENRFAGPRPELEMAGVQIVEDLAPYEHMKHRLLNGLQSAYAELGRLCGHDSSYGASTDPTLALWASVFLQDQALTLICPDGENLETYGHVSLKRLQNPTIHHPLNQIASDASFKLPQRIAAPAADLLVSGRSAEAQAMVLASWALQGGDRCPDHAEVVTSDPLGDELVALRARSNNADELALGLLNMPLWPAQLRENETFVANTAKWIGLFSHATAKQRRAAIEEFSRERLNA
ncbi:mannitol dehydrogenase family protein [Celeribacter halophilus]|uniref:Fructuronate reductase n=1 Tax=Celeribacter halophilus TaxID=576117 RepID=A0A1I3W3G3_9RHOB|nr:mannitol dehydrogenase family protein [Celeribacter halophilus]PZX09908.1 fructuronate reductase [Celeribacter halophilus]SFK01982.1 fructuronate reductase [Celeribacter halophilus]